MLVVLPALNEAPSVASVVRDVRSRYPHYDVLVVDDGSTDNTADRASEAGAIRRLPFNLGVGGAIGTAYKYAERAGYQVVVQVDADGQHNPPTSRNSWTVSLSPIWSLAHDSPG